MCPGIGLARRRRRAGDQLGPERAARCSPPTSPEEREPHRRDQLAGAGAAVELAGRAGAAPAGRPGGCCSRGAGDRVKSWGGGGFSARSTPLGARRRHRPGARAARRVITLEHVAVAVRAVLAVAAELVVADSVAAPATARTWRAPRWSPSSPARRGGRQARRAAGRGGRGPGGRRGGGARPRRRSRWSPSSTWRSPSSTWRWSPSSSPAPGANRRPDGGRRAGCRARALDLAGGRAGREKCTQIEDRGPAARYVEACTDLGYSWRARSEPVLTQVLRLRSRTSVASRIPDSSYTFSCRYTSRRFRIFSRSGDGQLLS